MYRTNCKQWDSRLIFPIKWPERTPFCFQEPRTMSNLRCGLDFRSRWHVRTKNIQSIQRERAHRCIWGILWWWYTGWWYTSPSLYLTSTARWMWPQGQERVENHKSEEDLNMYSVRVHSHGHTTREPAATAKYRLAVRFEEVEKSHSQYTMNRPSSVENQHLRRKATYTPH